MRALVLAGGGKPLEAVVGGVVKGLEETGFNVERREAEATSGPIPTGAYNLIVIGSTVGGLIKPKLAAPALAALGRCVRLEGRQIAAFVRERPFVGTRGMRGLMEAIERQGGFTRDFAALRDAKDAVAFGKRLHTLLDSGG